MTLVDIHLLNAALAERDAAREENARLRAAVESGAQEIERWICEPICADVSAGGECPYRHASRIIRAALAVPTADDGAERGAR